MGYEIVLVFMLFLAASAIRMPIGFAMLCSGVLYLFLAGQDPGLLSEQVMNNFFKSFVLLSVPLFIFAANIMNAGTISDRLFEFAILLVGRLRGGLAHVNVLTSLIFSGISGSAIADVAISASFLITFIDWFLSFICPFLEGVMKDWLSDKVGSMTCSLTIFEDL